MQHSHHENTENGNGESWLFSRTGIATIVAVSVLGFLIYQGHGAHLLGYAPFLLILACPLMHIFMHGGHGGHGGHQHSEEDTSALTPEERQKREAEQKQHKHGGCH